MWSRDFDEPTTRKEGENVLSIKKMPAPAIPVLSGGKVG
jgi:hypothetical protein